MFATKQRKLFAELIRSEKEFLISGHENPDGDVVGSTLALTLSLKNLGKKVYAFNRDGCPASLKFLPKTSLFISKIPNDFRGVLITVDSGNLARLGPEIGAYGFKEIWNIDHHKSNTRFGKHNFIDLKAASSGQAVLDLLEGCRGFKLTPDIANAIYCTLSTDTGSFKYSNATPEVFNLASRLVSHGAKPDVISQALYDTYPQRKLFLLQKVLGSLEFEKKGRLAKMFLTLDDVLSTGASYDDSEDFVNLPRGVEGVKVVCFYRQIEKETWKLSLRSRGKGEVLSAATALGGGGHKQAAGATVKGDRKTVVRTVENILKQQFLL